MDGTVVVGVDGSPASDSALEWAARYAEASGASVLGVTAWHIPTSTMWSVDTSELASGARQILEDALKVARERHPGVTFSGLVDEGVAAPILLEASRTADLLVVGSRGHGAFTGMLLGSVSLHCVHHARCPVVVVPGEEQ
jgi:nucleotide-binding universal stress UspA family protein